MLYERFIDVFTSRFADRDIGLYNLCQELVPVGYHLTNCKSVGDMFTKDRHSIVRRFMILLYAKSSYITLEDIFNECPFNVRKHHIDTFFNYLDELKQYYSEKQILYSLIYSIKYLIDKDNFGDGLKNYFLDEVITQYPYIEEYKIYIKLQKLIL